ncbi:hypothetical protein RJ55_06890 [Drechmeria coniospora]|nr:hypothetical protein RJ55_06890 [Drechmeria coniospora]
MAGKAVLLLASLALQVSALTLPGLPQLTLPWGKWEATPSPGDPNIYLFQNVRFGAKPERFGAPTFPNWRSNTIQRVTQNTSCIQIDPSQLKKPPGGKDPLGDPSDADLTETEDCLFLDIYAPASAFQPGARPLPVVVWIYGGAFAFGTKNQAGPLYTGQSVLHASGYQTIFIVGNYRVGAYGWLAGDYMQKVGQPNAGLHDQALLFRWVQNYVRQVGGDRNRVSAWGESAGAGSILHHVTREDGRVDPLFSTLAVQSPAFEWAWDNTPGERLDNLYRNFSLLAGCSFDFNITCLRSASGKKLARANQQLFNNVRQTGLFPVGPAVDGKWIKSIPTLAFAQGKFWKGIKSAIISHCANEPHSFTPPDIDNQTRFDEFLTTFLPGAVLEPERDKIRAQYDCLTKFGGDFQECIATVIRDASFTCNTRDLFDSYSDRSYMMHYGFPLDKYAYHASDLIPLFMNNRTEAEQLLIKSGLNETIAGLYAGSLNDKVKQYYQNYFASFALSGNPNRLLPSPPRQWPIANGARDQLSDVMHVGWAFSKEHVFQLDEDEQNSSSACSFWTEIAKDITQHRTAGQGHGSPSQGPGEAGEL